MLKHFGRTPLGNIVGQWSDNHPLNPRLLASEVAATLRTLAPEDHPTEPKHAGIYHNGLAQRDATIVITHGALADYFDSASTAKPSPTLDTSAGPLPATNVLIWQSWIDTVTHEAIQRMGTVEALMQPANNGVHIALASNDPAPAARHEPQLAMPSGSSPGYLKMHQDQMRKDGERSATEQLDNALRIAQHHDKENGELRAHIAVLNTRIAHFQGQLELSSREANEAIRAKLKALEEVTELSDELAGHAGLIEFNNPNNPLSPPEGREMIACWCEQTENGQVDVVSKKGKGWAPLCRDWLKKNGHNSTAKVKRFTTALTGCARKKGGAVQKNG